MKICMVVSTMLEFGGLEEFAKNLAVGISQQGHQVSVLSTTWVPSDNQYLHSFYDNHVSFIQLPKWISLITTDWPTKEKILKFVLLLSSPIVYLLASILYIFHKRTWSQSLSSSKNWLRGQWLNRVIGPDHHKPFAKLLLDWWRLRWSPDLIHIHGYTSSLLFVIDWAHTRGIPVVYEEQQTPDPQFDWWEGFQKSINKAAIVVAVSEKSAEGLRTVCGVTRPIVVEGPLIPDPMASGWKKDGEADKKSGPLNITAFARLYVTKGLPYLLEAIVKVQSLFPQVRFKVYGDGPLRQELLHYAEKLNLDGEAIFVGSFTDRKALSRIMAETDIFVMSSILEGQPLSLVEAMSYGCPIVATTVGGIPELIQDGINGLLCEPADPDCLAKKLCILIENPDLRESLGKEARKSYKEGPFQAVSVSNRFISIYTNALQQKDLKSDTKLAAS